MTSCLVLLGDSAASWEAKGEITERYLNPRNIFDTVDIVSIQQGRPSDDALRALCGDATFSYLSYPAGTRLFLRTLGWSVSRLHDWAEAIRSHARVAHPSLIRAVTPHLNSYLALEASRAANAPFTVSLHINPDTDLRWTSLSAKEAISELAIQRLRHYVLPKASMVLPVYQSILPYTTRMGCPKVEVAYNAVGAGFLNSQQRVRGRGFRLISVGRQIPAKSPEPLVRAVAARSDWSLTLVGDGPLHSRMVKLSESLGLAHRINFLTSVPNSDLVNLLGEHDAFIAYSEFWEMSKAVIEAMLSGLPVVLNVRKGSPVPELPASPAVLVSGDPNSYVSALDRLDADVDLLRHVGERTRQFAVERWSPTQAEHRLATLFQQVMDAGPPESVRE